MRTVSHRTGPIATAVDFKLRHYRIVSEMAIFRQLADLVAHTCAVMLLAELGLVKKTVKAGENSGYDPTMRRASR